MRGDAPFGSPSAFAQARLDLARPLKLGVIGPYDANHDTAFEVRAFIGGGYEDPVTGSLNASLAQWLIGAGLAKSSYVASQGTALERVGRVHLRKDDEGVWVGGNVVGVIQGEVNLDETTTP